MCTAQKNRIAIAIDGPAGAGKSTIAQAIAKELGYIYVDTGALYRAVGLYAISRGTDTVSAEDIGKLLPDIRVELCFINGEQRVFLGGEDVSEKIRQPEISMAASNVSAIGAVRDFLFSLQQNIAEENNVVMDGRDIGTVVLPHAQIKIFLTAAPEERARRRYEELLEKGHMVDYDALLQEVRQRDFNDANRPIAPLRQARDAMLVDTTGNTLELLIGIVKEKLKDVL